MALDYLSDDEFAEIYGRAERRARRARRRAKREARPRRQRRRARQAEQYEKRGGKPRTVARVALAPARGAFLTLVNLNALKLGTKLARAFHKSGGKKQLQKFWFKFGGKWAGLAKAISKGAKQRISLDEDVGVGSAIAVAVATATPLIIALVPIIRALGAEGDKGEKSLLQRGIATGKKLLAKDKNISKSVVTMPADSQVAVLQRDGTDLKDDRDIDERPRGFSFFSLTGLLWKLPFVMMFWSTGIYVLDLLIATVSTYCIVGLVLLPFELRRAKWVRWYFRPFKYLGYELNSKTHG